MPPWASGPVLTVNRPSLNGAACAMDGAGKLNAAAAVPAAVAAMNLRLVILRDIAFLPFCRPWRVQFCSAVLAVSGHACLFDAAHFLPKAAIPHHGGSDRAHHRPSRSTM